MHFGLAKFTCIPLSSLCSSLVMRAHEGKMYVIIYWYTNKDCSDSTSLARSIRLLANLASSRGQSEWYFFFDILIGFKIGLEWLLVIFHFLISEGCLKPYFDIFIRNSFGRDFKPCFIYFGFDRLEGFGRMAGNLSGYIFDFVPEPPVLPY